MLDSATRLVTSHSLPGEFREELSLRPQTFDEIIGQTAVVSILKVMVQAARGRGEAMDHVLLCGPPGLGKTTLAHLIARELGGNIHSTSGPALEKKDLAGVLSNLSAGDVLFIDEIHRLPAVVEEYLYPAMEDFKIDFVIGAGPHARSVPLPLPRFTLIGATTRTGLLTGPMRDRFGYCGRVAYYGKEELELVVQRSARILGVSCTVEGAREIARRCRGTPRIANRLLHRVRDFAEVEGSGVIDVEIARHGLLQLGIDEHGFDEMDRRLLETLVCKYAGGPVGVDTLGASMGEEPDTIESVYEPFLMQEGLIKRSPRGRMATARAYEFLKLPPPKGEGGSGQVELGF